MCICTRRERPNYMRIQCYNSYNIHIRLLSLVHLCHVLFCLFARFYDFILPPFRDKTRPARVSNRPAFPGYTPDGKLWALNEGGAPFRFNLDKAIAPDFLDGQTEMGNPGRRVERSGVQFPGFFLELVAFFWCKNMMLVSGSVTSKGLKRLMLFYTDSLPVYMETLDITTTDSTWINWFYFHGSPTSVFFTRRSEGSITTNSQKKNAGRSSWKHGLRWFAKHLEGIDLGTLVTLLFTPGKDSYRNPRFAGLMGFTTMDHVTWHDLRIGWFHESRTKSN